MVGVLGGTRSTTGRIELRIGEDADAAGFIERMGETRFAEGVTCSCDGDPYGHTSMLHELPCGSEEV